VSGGWIVIADNSVDLSKYSFVMPSSVSLGYVKVSGPAGTGLLFRNWMGTAWDGACFLAGSMIKTPQGMIAVEDLRIGMEVCVLDAQGQETIDRIISVESKMVKNDDFVGSIRHQPVRILKNAFSENVPDNDLRVTEEHCIFIDGKFVPVRMLVNGISIVYEEIDQYEYFHIEFETHRIVVSNNLKTESYLRTRENAQSILSDASHGTLKSWENDAAAPLDTSRNFVEGIFLQLLERAKTLWGDHEISSESRCSTFVQLEDGRGNIITPLRITDQKYIFAVNTADRDLLLVSSCARPSDLIGSFIDDRRHLGAHIGAISVYGANTSYEYDIHLTEDLDFGWHRKEEASYRWTNGVAPLRDINPESMSDYIICIEIKEIIPTIENIAA